jgi:hypothetical protein
LPLAETQTGYVLALYMNLVPKNVRKSAGARLAAMIEKNDGRLATGFSSEECSCAYAPRSHLRVIPKDLLPAPVPTYPIVFLHASHLPLTRE